MCLVLQFFCISEFYILLLTIKWIKVVYKLTNVHMCSGGVKFLLFC